MVTASLLILAVIFWILYVRAHVFDYEFWFVFLATAFSMLSIIAIIFFLSSEQNYYRYLEKRKSIEFTIQNARESGNHEDAGIVLILKEYNEDLSVRKYNNTLFLFDEFIDDRFDELELLR